MQADDHFVGLVYVAGVMRGDGGAAVGGHVQHALGAFLLQQFAQGIPQLGALGGASQEAVVAFVRLIVQLDEVADIDLALPVAGDEIAPRVGLGSILVMASIWVPPSWLIQ